MGFKETQKSKQENKAKNRKKVNCWTVYNSFSLLFKNCIHLLIFQWQSVISTTKDRICRSSSRPAAVSHTSCPVISYTFCLEKLSVTAGLLSNVILITTPSMPRKFSTDSPVVIPRKGKKLI